MKEEEMHKYGKLILNLVIYIAAILAVIFILPRILGFFMPFIVGGIIAAIANPFVKFLETKLRIKRKAGTVVVIIAVIAIICGIGYLIASIFIRQAIGFIQSLPQLWESTKQDLEQLAVTFQRLLIKVPVEWQESFQVMTEKFGEMLAKSVTGVTDSSNSGSVGSVVGNIATIIIDVIMGALSAYFFIADKDYFFEWIRKYVPRSIMSRWDVVYSSLKHAVGGYFKAQLKIEVWVYGLLLIGLTLLNVNYAFLIAFGIAILDFLPFLGTGAVMVPWAFIKFFTGDYLICFGLVVIWGLSQLIRQLIQPKIMGDSIGMAPIPTLFLLFIGYRLGGVFGMIVSVPIGIIVVNLNQAGLFDTPKLSIRLLIANINQYRKLTQEDLRILEKNKDREPKDH